MTYYEGGENRYDNWLSLGIVGEGENRRGGDIEKTVKLAGGPMNSGLCEILLNSSSVYWLTFHRREKGGQVDIEGWLIWEKSPRLSRITRI